MLNAVVGLLSLPWKCFLELVDVTHLLKILLEESLTFRFCCFVFVLGHGGETRIMLSLVRRWSGACHATNYRLSGKGKCKHAYGRCRGQKHHLSSRWSVYRYRSYLRGWNGFGKSNLTGIEPSRSSRGLVSRSSRGGENLSIDNFPMLWKHWPICLRELS